MASVTSLTCLRCLTCKVEITLTWDLFGSKEMLPRFASKFGVPKVFTSGALQRHKSTCEVSACKHPNPFQQPKKRGTRDPENLWKKSIELDNFMDLGWFGDQNNEIGIFMKTKSLLLAMQWEIKVRDESMFTVHCPSLSNWCPTSLPDSLVQEVWWETHDDWWVPDQMVVVS